MRAIRTFTVDCERIPSLPNFGTLSVAEGQVLGRTDPIVAAYPDAFGPLEG